MASLEESSKLVCNVHGSYVVPANILMEKVFNFSTFVIAKSLVLRDH